MHWPHRPPGLRWPLHRPRFHGPVAWVDVAWAVFSVANLAAILIFSRWETVPFHFIWITLTLLYGFRVWSTRPTAWVLAVAMFWMMVWHAQRRLAADNERDLVSEDNARLLTTQRRFLQDASHQLRTPITIALGHAELLARDLAGRAEARDIEVVVGELTRLRRLGERLLTIAASEDPDFLRPEPVALDGFALEAFRKWMPTARRRWTLGHLDPVLVTADRERLGLAVDALLENAVRHTAEGEKIRLEVVRDHDGDTARLIVADGGDGIPPAELDRIFDRFRSGTQLGGTRGTGLGLALVRAVARAHGGEVRVRSAPGKGSEFALVLPVGPAPAPPAPAAPGAELLGSPGAGRAVPSDVLGAGSRPAYASGDPRPPGAGRTTVEGL